MSELLPFAKKKFSALAQSSDPRHYFLAEHVWIYDRYSHFQYVKGLLNIIYQNDEEVGGYVQYSKTHHPHIQYDVSKNKITPLIPFPIEDFYILSRLIISMETKENSHITPDTSYDSKERVIKSLKYGNKRDKLCETIDDKIKDIFHKNAYIKHIQPLKILLEQYGFSKDLNDLNLEQFLAFCKPVIDSHSYQFIPHIN